MNDPLHRPRSDTRLFTIIFLAVLCALATWTAFLYGYARTKLDQAAEALRQPAPPR